MSALLEAAAAALRTAKDPRKLRSVTDWVAADDHEWPLSFVNVCAALEVDAEAARKSLQSLPGREPRLGRCAGAACPDLTLRRRRG